MRFMLMLKATKDSEAGAMPEPALFAAMDRFNQSMMEAGAFISAEGLQPSAKGARVTFSGGSHVVTDGPFAKTRELIAGYWLINAKSLDEAVDWARRCPGGDGAIDHFGGSFEIEVRQLFDMSDFPPEIIEQIPFEASQRS